MTKYKFKVYTDQNDFKEYAVYAKDGMGAINELEHILGVDGHDGTAYYVYVLEPRD
nr:MAG TPA: hypothetical protein [Caudoviricetes sp.]